MATGESTAASVCAPRPARFMGMHCKPYSAAPLIFFLPEHGGNVVNDGGHPEEESHSEGRSAEHWFRAEMEMRQRNGH